VKALDNDDQEKLPKHIAIIMDGNGRWAKRRGLARHFGHEQGAKTVEDIVRYASELGIKYITLYAFSSENWLRPQEEIDAIMKILERYLKNDVNELVKNDIKIMALGDLNRLPPFVRFSLQDAIDKTVQCQKLIVTLALSYGSWEELTRGIKNILLSDKEKTINIDSIDENFVRGYLYTRDLPDPELFIRTGGEVRLSNFLLLQISYSELYFCKTLWPEFQRSDFDLALKSFLRRERRFGTIVED
jgi:undecaprenyl diphosphate synthase